MIPRVGYPIPTRLTNIPPFFLQVKTRTARKRNQLAAVTDKVAVVSVNALTSFQFRPGVIEMQTATREHNATTAMPCASDFKVNTTWGKEKKNKNSFGSQNSSHGEGMALRVGNGDKKKRESADLVGYWLSLIHVLRGSSKMPHMRLFTPQRRVRHEESHQRDGWSQDGQLRSPGWSEVVDKKDETK